MRKKVSGGGGRKEENGPLPPLPPPPPPLLRGRERGRCIVAHVRRVQGSWRGTGKGLMVNYVYKMVYLVKQMPCKREGERQRERQRERASVFVREGARERECRVGHVSLTLMLLLPYSFLPPLSLPSPTPFVGASAFSRDGQSSNSSIPENGIRPSPPVQRKPRWVFICLICLRS